MTTSGATGGVVEVTELLPTGDTGGTPAWSLAFHGTGVAWYGITGPAGGRTEVFVDGVSSGIVDAYSAATSSVKVLWIRALPRARSPRRPHRSSPPPAPAPEPVVEPSPHPTREPRPDPAPDPTPEPSSDPVPPPA